MPPNRSLQWESLFLHVVIFNLIFPYTGRQCGPLHVPDQPSCFSFTTACRRLTSAFVIHVFEAWVPTSHHGRWRFCRWQGFATCSVEMMHGLALPGNVPIKVQDQRRCRDNDRGHNLSSRNNCQPPRQRFLSGYQHVEQVALFCRQASLSVCLSVCLSVWLAGCLSVCLSVLCV